MDNKNIIGERIRFYRKANHITQIDLAGKLGVAPRYIGNIEQGHRKPSLDMMVEICNFFGIGLSDILPIRDENVICPKEQLIYEIATVCRTLEINQIGVVKSIACAFNK